MARIMTLITYLQLLYHMTPEDVHEEHIKYELIDRRYIATSCPLYVDYAQEETFITASVLALSSIVKLPMLDTINFYGYCWWDDIYNRKSNE
jgi:hypothetical protein